jgi:oligoribonuclease NrnB/cAMP/cGMP phosphodiesterase (DHH superfamily)
MAKHYCLYHKNCLDGFTSAWVVKKFYEKRDPRNYPLFDMESLDDLSFIPMDYGDPVPEMNDGSIVYLVDFSLPPGVLEELAKVHKHIYVFDHHKSAIDKFESFYKAGLTLPDNVHLTLDIKRSGCQITWDELFDIIPQRPLLVNFVGDRDLWQFKHKDTKFICRTLMSAQQTFENWSVFDKKLNNSDDYVTLKQIGYALMSDDQIKLAWHADNCLRFIELTEGVNVFTANIPKYLVSEFNDLLLNTRKCPNGFVTAYHDTETQRIFRLNSLEGSGVDVSKYAEMFGGGGHKHSASFKVDRDHYLAKI